MRVKHKVSFMVGLISFNLNLKAEIPSIEFSDMVDIAEQDYILSQEIPFDDAYEYNDPITRTTQETTTEEDDITIPSVHINPTQISINKVNAPIFTESHIIVPEIEEVVETDSENQDNIHVSNSQEQLNVNSTNETSIGEDFNHTKSNYLEILSTEPLFTESDEIEPNTQANDIPEYTINDYTETDITEYVPPFEENEDVPERDESEEIPEIPIENNEDETSEATETESIPSYKNPDTKKEDIPTNNPTLSEDEHVSDTNDGFIPPLPPKNDSWEYATDYGNGWCEVDWFGIFFKLESDKPGYGWIYHIKLGWIYIHSENYESVWVWMDDLKGWCWTNSFIYPYFYTDDTNDWIFYSEDKNIFFDYNLNNWIAQ